MSLALQPLPTDPDALRAYALALRTNLATLETEHHFLKQEAAANKNELYEKSLMVEKLRGELATLKRNHFGRSSEKVDRRIDQLEFLLEELEIDVAQINARQNGQKRERTTDRQPAKELQERRQFPAHWPRERVEHKAPCVCKNCGGTKLVCLGITEREVMEYVPSYFKVIIHCRPKMSCRSCESVMQPPMPSLPITRGMAGPATLAHVLTSKFCDHVPLNRQVGIYARVGADIDKSTLTDWVAQSAALMEPLAEAIARHVRAGETIHADDTPVPVLAPGTGKTKTGRLWVAVRDERPWGSSMPPAVYYQYAPDRRSERAEALLKDCRGYLHADAYAGHNTLYRPQTPGAAPRLIEVACWAHSRRKIYDVHLAAPSPAAEAIIQTIGLLFDIERDIRGQVPHVRLAARREKSLPVLDQLHQLMQSTYAKISVKSSLAKAIAYSLTRWTALTCYTTDGRLEISNNTAERAMRPPALGRKNWTFAGSDHGGERAAILYTLIESAKINNIDPEAYLLHILTYIADHPINRIADLLPWNLNGVVHQIAI
jgi:transposase